MLVVKLVTFGSSRYQVVAAEAVTGGGDGSINRVNFSRMFGVEVPPGTLLLNPQGIHHGLPEEVRRWYKAHWRKDEYYDWQLINVDCERPLQVTAEAQAAARGANHLYDSRA